MSREGSCQGAGAPRCPGHSGEITNGGHPPLGAFCVEEPVRQPCFCLWPPRSQIPVWARRDQNSPRPRGSPDSWRPWAAAESSLGHLSRWNGGDCITGSPLHTWEAEVRPQPADPALSPVPVPESEADQSLCGPRGSAQQPASSCYYAARTAAGTLSRQTAGRTEPPTYPWAGALEETEASRGSVPGATHTACRRQRKGTHKPHPGAYSRREPESALPAGAGASRGRGLAGVGGAGGGPGCLDWVLL